MADKRKVSMPEAMGSYRNQKTANFFNNQTLTPETYQHEEGSVAHRVLEGGREPYSRAMTPLGDAIQREGQRNADRAAGINGAMRAASGVGANMHQGISPTARHNSDALDSVLRGNPDLAKQLKPGEIEEIKRRLSDPAEIDRIKKATGMRDDGTVPTNRSSTPKERANNAMYWNNRARNHDVRGDGPADTTKQRPAARTDGVNAFAKADAKFKGRQQNGEAPAEGGSQVGAGKRGFGNPKNQAAAQKAKGNKYEGPTE